MNYLLRRILAVVPVLLIVSVLVFAMVFLSGDPAVLMMPPEATAEEVAQFRAVHGFDDPFWVQYGRFLERAIHGDFGKSLRYNQPALELVQTRIPATLQLASLSIFLAVIVGVPLGILSAIRQRSWIDYTGTFLAVIGQSLPNYVLGFLLVYLVAVKWKMLPTSGGPGWPYALLPSITIAFAIVALITRMTRSNMLEVLGEDYIRTARAKGLHGRQVIIGHALRNAMLPVITIVALQFGYILGGAVVIETIFAWPGLGLLTIQAIYNRDYPVVQLRFLFLAVMFVLINLVVDVASQWLDPRAREA